MALSTQPYKGARDFYPEDKRLQKWMFGTMREVVERFGYEEYDAPILESTEIYAAKTSEEVVKDQTYTFEDRGGRSVTIRTEMTPSVSRMIAGRRQEVAYPARWYSIPNFWRYERPQKGRLREFWQLNVDLFGIDNVTADFEMIQIADSVMQAFGAKRDMYTIRVNSRKLIDHVLVKYLGLKEAQALEVIRLTDKMHKMERPKFVDALDGLLSAAQKEAKLTDKIMGILEVKSLKEVSAKLAGSEVLAELRQLLELCQQTRISNVEFDITLMRGFDYYTDIVFEVFDTNPDNNRSMFGGGRYDGLVGLFGVEPVPSVGFAMGDVTLEEFLKAHKLLPALEPEADIYVVLIGDVFSKAQKVIADMRELGLRVVVDSSGRKLDKQIKSADKKRLKYVLFVGEKELEEGRYKLKNLQSGAETSVALDEIAKAVKSR